MSTLLGYNVPQKPWKDTWGNLVPQVEHSEGIRPHVGYVIAPWLPLNLAGGVRDVSVQEYFSVMPGKIMAVARDGFLVPAGLAELILASGSGDTILTYTQLDVDERVTDLETGTYLTVAKTVTKANLQTALQNRGILRSGESIDNYISNPVGVAFLPIYNCFASDPDNPTTYRRHNFTLQPRVAIVCDYVLVLAHVPEKKSTLAFDGAGTIKADTTYSSSHYYLDMTNTLYMPLAGALSLTTPYAFPTDANNLFTSRRSDQRQVSQTGHYFVDDVRNRIYFYHGGNLAAAQAAATGVVADVWHYNSVADISTGKYACVMGDVQPGDYLMASTQSNWIKCFVDHKFPLGTDAPASYNQGSAQANLLAIRDAIRNRSKIMGQVLGIDRYPLSSLELVRSNKGLPNNLVGDSMPGNATEGIVDRITYPGGANRLVIVNIVGH